MIRVRILRVGVIVMMVMVIAFPVMMVVVVFLLLHHEATFTCAKCITQLAIFDV